MSDLTTALNAQGLRHLTARDHLRAMAFFRTAITHDPAMADAYTNLGVAQFMHHQFPEAVATLRQSLALRPDHPETLLNFGYSLWRINEMKQAAAAFRRAIETGNLHLAHIALGGVYWELGEDELAIEHCRIGLVTEPTNFFGLDTLREIYHYRGCEDDAVAASEALIAVAPNYPRHQHKKSLIKLTYGNADGWAERECRYDYLEGLTQTQRDDPSWFATLFGKRWDGRKTGHLLISTEQGFGDVIQFLRYIPLALERCDTLSLHLPPALQRIAQQSFPQAKVYDSVRDPLPVEFDHYCLIMSLAYLLGRTDPPAPPYLAASAHGYGEVRRLPGLKVGLAWTGSKTHPDNRWRSLPFEMLTPLFEVAASFVSLQFPPEIDLKPYPITVVHPTPTSFGGNLMIDWTETAALIAALDLVICADTAVAHMAGAIGKPVWLLNRYNTDWRWMLKREDTPWYPSMRIFRQPRMGDWSAVIARVRDELKALVLDR